MKNGLKSVLAKSALAGSLLFSGCATSHNWTQNNVRGNSTYVPQTIIESSESKYFFDRQNCEQNAEYLDIFLRENRKETIRTYTLKTTPIEDILWEGKAYPQSPIGCGISYTCFSAFSLGIPLIRDTILFCTDNETDTTLYYISSHSLKGPVISGTTRALNRHNLRTEKERLNEKTFLVQTNTPASRKRFDANSSSFNFDGQGSAAIYSTNEKGMARVSFSPNLGILSKKKAEENISNILNETYRPGSLNEITNGMIFVSEFPASIKLTTSDDEINFKVPVYFVEDPRLRVNEQIKKSLENYLSSNFPLKEVEIEVRERVSRVFLKDVTMEAKQLSGPTKETIDQAQIKFLSYYFKNEGDYSECLMDSQKFLSAIPKELLFSKKLSGSINKGAVYEIEFTHLGHVAAKRNVDFESEENPIPVSMDRLAAPIENREAEEDAGTSSIGKKR
jgi:hypothetical protein